MPCLQRFFNTQQLVVLGNPVRTAQRTSLDLACAGSNRQVSNGGSSVSPERWEITAVASVLSHLDSVQSLGQAANLVELDQDELPTLLDALLQDLGVGYEKVITPAEPCCRAYQSEPSNRPSHSRPYRLRWTQSDSARTGRPGNQQSLLNQSSCLHRTAGTDRLCRTRKRHNPAPGLRLCQFIASVFNSLLDRSQGRFIGRQVRRKPPSSPTAVFRP